MNNPTINISTSFKMKTINNVFSLVALCTLLASSATAQYITLTAVHSGSSLQYEPINANNERLWIGKPTASYCPSDVASLGACPNTTGITNFAYAGGELGMGAEVPGGQNVYIDPACGAVMYTVAHSDYMPKGAITGGWSLDQEPSYGSLFHNNGLLACSVTNNSAVAPWELFVALKHIEYGDNCLGISIFTQNMSQVAAWEYE